MNDIVTALECCINEATCVNCPFKSEDGDGCRYSATDIYVIVLDYIKHLNKVIERLQKERDQLKLELSYTPKPNTIGDSHEMGSW